MLIGQLGVEYIRGIQEGNGTVNTTYLKIQATPKHLGVYSVECYNENGSVPYYPHCQYYRSFFNSKVDEVDLREGYLPGSVKDSASGLMVMIGWRRAVEDAHATGGYIYFPSPSNLVISHVQL